MSAYIQGIDISEHNGTINFDAVIGNGIQVVSVKATEGQRFIDPRFGENWRALLERPQLVRGAYHFARIDSDVDTPDDAEREALDFCRALRELGGLDDMLPPWLDLEWAGATSNAPLNVAWAARWIEVCTAELRRTPGIYTGRNAWRGLFSNSTKFLHLPLWQADINRPSGRPISMDVDWSPVAHQYSHTGQIAGIKTRVDLDVIIGGDAALEQLLGLGVVREPEGLVMPRIDLAELVPSLRNEIVARVQGLLLSHGTPKEGLTGADGLPDGKPGAKTRAALSSFRGRVGLTPSTVVDGETWWRLLLAHRG